MSLGGHFPARRSHMLEGRRSKEGERPVNCRRGGRSGLWYWGALPLIGLLALSPVILRATWTSAAEPAGEQAPAGTPGNGASDILNLDIEQLSQTPVNVPSMDMPVTTVTRDASTVGRSAAAVFVITNEMIRRSGATCVPEALRMVPGLEVARIDSNRWAVTSRGFNGSLANKLLVLIDGRSVYTPVFSGVYWGEQDVFLEDVERIVAVHGFTPAGTGRVGR